MPSKDSQNYWVKFIDPGLHTFTYMGQVYDRGELIQLTGSPHDEQLTRMEFVMPAPKADQHRHAECGVCNRWFVNEMFRDAHGRRWHRERFQPDALEVAAGMHGPDGGAALRDITGDAEERRMQAEFPLRLDRTKATLEST